MKLFPAKCHEWATLRKLWRQMENSSLFPVNSSLLTTVARDGWNLSTVFKFCFCFVLLYNKSLNDWSLGEQWILFPSNLNVSWDEVEGNIEFEGNKIHSSPRDQSLSVYCLIPLELIQLQWLRIDNKVLTFLMVIPVICMGYPIY